MFDDYIHINNLRMINGPTETKICIIFVIYNVGDTKSEKYKIYVHVYVCGIPAQTFYHTSDMFDNFMHVSRDR